MSFMGKTDVLRRRAGSGLRRLQRTRAADLALHRTNFAQGSGLGCVERGMSLADRRLRLAPLLALATALLATAPAAAATSTPRVLPTVEGELKAGSAQARDCITSAVTGRGVT
jgi:hypothetical protein